MQPRILFFADAGAAVGGGHVMRSLTLAEALIERGAACSFVATPAVSDLLDVFAGPKVQRVMALSDGAHWRPNMLVIDHYGVGAAHERALAGSARLAAIDDLARQHAVDMIVDPSLGRSATDYAGQGAKTVLAGPTYALVRPAFAAAREAALARRGGEPRRCLVSLGLADLDGITGRIVELLLQKSGDVALDVVAGSGAASLPALKDLAGKGRITLHVDTRDMAELVANADIAVGAGGSSVWERATLGLPTILLVLAENQKAMAEQLQNAGLALVLDPEARRFETQLTDAWRRLTGSADLRRELSERPAALCDGHGAGRVAEAMLQLLG
ncbi:MAG: UDP-2,4-diacetamido-2,4,6-trideoxy-beta-L-altropyranose hydrolase [Caulobacteraceae bacterium]|nr:UDP-2,4-diacetamido-2,4,6-trideoxy-beta-L-altropyranose hydrolase [Caulobacteraceae bacterium]